MINSLKPYTAVSMWTCSSLFQDAESLTTAQSTSLRVSPGQRHSRTRIVRSLKDGNPSLKAVQKLLIHSVGDRDYSAQETCHILLQLPMYKASRDFNVLSLDGSRAVEQHVQQDGRATALSILDHYVARPATLAFNNITLLEFAQQYTMPKELGAQPNRRNKKVVVITRPYCPPDPAGPKYE